MKRTQSNTARQAEQRARRWLARFAVLLFAVGAAGSTCSDAPSVDSTCISDEDCHVDEACVANFCSLVCESDSDCGLDQTCAPVRMDEGEPTRVCVHEETTTNNGGAGECVSDLECAEQYGQQSRCSPDGFCFVPEQRAALLLRDVTLEPTAEDMKPGVDIAAVFLRDPATGEMVAFGDTLDYEPVGDIDGASHLQGDRPLLNIDEQCIEGTLEDDTTSLGGDGGQMLLRFLDPSFRDYPPPSQTAWEIVVIAWGTNCDPLLVEGDRYEASLCLANSYDAIRLESDCELLPGSPASGHSSFVVGDQ